MEIIATAESVTQALDLLAVGVDALIIGEARYGLRLPGYFNIDEMDRVIAAAHQAGKRVYIAMNAILHNDKIDTARPFLAAIKALSPDGLIVGDTGLIQILKETPYHLPYIYDASVLVTSPGQINFWANYGAIGAILAREVPYCEMQALLPAAKIPVAVQVYGASCIHHSKRPLLTNYFNYIGKNPAEHNEHELFLSEPKKDETHYAIFEDEHGTHIFANDDLDLLPYMGDLWSLGVHYAYLDGIYTKGIRFVQIASYIVQARDAIKNGQWTAAYAKALDDKLRAAQSPNRELGTGFFLYESNRVK